MSDLEGYVDSYLAGNGIGTVSVWYGGLVGPPTYARDEQVQHYAASTMKLPLLVAAYSLAEQGGLDLDREVPVHNQFRSVADGSAFALDRADDQDDETWDRIGGTASLRWLAEHSIVRSGNLATNLVLERVGADNVGLVLRAAGCSSGTVLPRGIEDSAARRAGVDNLVTAADLALVMRGIAARTIAAEPTCAAAEQVLGRQEHRDKVPAGLPAGTYVANKTGWVEGVAHDVALVRPRTAEPYVLAVCTTMDLPEDESSAHIAEISRRIWEARSA